VRFWPFRARWTDPDPAPRANPIRIAVLEHDLFGVQPEPGSAAALQIALRRTGTCVTHRPVETTEFGDPRAVGMCLGCGRSMLQQDDGRWVIAQ
jgi:hypothetical protein